MFKNYFKTAFRGFWKHKLFTLINVIGLSVGISAALVIYLIVLFDFTFDQFRPDGDRIYRVVTNFTFAGQPAPNPGVCAPLPAAVKAGVTGVEALAPLYKVFQPDVTIAHSKNKFTRFKAMENVTLADAGFFQVFPYKWLAGSAKTALNAPYQVVLTSDQATKYFPGVAFDQLTGKTILYDSLKATITGVVQTIKQNTDFTFHDFISYSTATVDKDLKSSLKLTNWGGTSVKSQLYVKLYAGTSTANIVSQLNQILHKNSPPVTGKTQSFALQPLNDVHFNANYGTYNGRVANKTTLFELFAIALFLLLLGCINFINLTTAQASQRAKEIGIRKTMGSSRPQLIIQFLSETFLITLIAVVISVAAAPVILKLFSGFIPIDVSVDIVSQPVILAFLLGLMVIVSLLSGFYPAIILSGHKPVSVIKNQAQTNSSKTRNAVLRKSLTVTQFIIAQFFIMATVMVGKQIHYAINKDLGFKKDAILWINTPFKSREDNRAALLMNKLHAIPQIEMISAGNDAPSSDDTGGTEATFNDGHKEIKMNIDEKFGDENYIKVYHIPLLAGRNLQPADIGIGLLINQTYAKILGFKTLSDAVGKQLENFNGDTRMRIVGVTGDFHQGSLHAAIDPLVILTGTSPYFRGVFHVALKPQTVNGGDWQKAISSMQAAWKEIYPNDDFDYQFVDETVAKLYVSEQNTSMLLTWATGLSIFISCLGLLGLAIYTTTQRTKEIGVRKVLGATVGQMVRLLSTELVLLIALAFVLVTPVAWYAMNKWMQSYADRTGISWWIFATSGGGMLMVAMFTSSFQTVKAAMANPVKSLRSE